MNLRDPFHRRNLCLPGELRRHAFFLHQLPKRLRAAAHQAEQIVHGLGLRHIVVFVLAERYRAAAEQACRLALGHLILLAQGNNFSASQQSIDPLAKRHQHPPVELAFRHAGKIGRADIAHPVVQRQHGLMALVIAFDLGPVHTNFAGQLFEQKWREATHPRTIRTHCPAAAAPARQRQAGKFQSAQRHAVRGGQRLQVALTAQLLWPLAQRVHAHEPLDQGRRA